MRSRGGPLEVKKLLLLALLAGLFAVVWWRRSESSAADAGLAPDSAPREIEFLAVAPASPPSEPADPRAASPTLLRSFVRGRCVDARGRPLSDVELDCAFPPARARSDADGRFELALDSLEASALRASIRARRTGLGVRLEQVELEVGSSATLVDWVLAPAATLRGVVRDGAGQPLEGLEVRCAPAEFACAGACATPRGPTLCSTLTDANGAFVLDEAPAGELCVWAGAYGQTLWVSTQPFSARAGELIEDLALVAPRVARETLLGVRVLDPRGRPVAGARVDYRFHDRGRGGSGAGEADESGRWLLDVGQRAPHFVLARDPRGRFQPTLLAELEPGVIDVPLVLGAARRVELRVLDASGSPITSFALRVSEATSDEVAPGVPVDPLVLVDEPERERRNGKVVLDAPSFPFVLDLRASGALDLRAGPFVTEDLHAGLELVLRRPPGVSGTVRAEGAPHAGASVSLHRTVDAAAGASEVRYGPALETATTDAEGRFRLACPESGSYWVRAAAAEFADTDLGPLQVDAQSGFDAAQLELTRGGAIEGRARAAHGERAEGSKIVARRGDGFDRSVSTDAAGAFRFERMTPGPWILERAAPTPGSAGAPSAAVLCDVNALAVTQVELPAPDADLAVLSGRFALGGAPASAWRVECEGRTATCDANGAFEIAALLPGARRVALTAPNDDGATWRIEGELILRAGLNEWRLDQPVGRVQGRTRRGAAAAGEVLTWRWNSDATWNAFGSVRLGVGGDFTLSALPAGRVELISSALEALTLQIDATTTVDVEL